MGTRRTGLSDPAFIFLLRMIIHYAFVDFLFLDDHNPICFRHWPYSFLICWTPNKHGSNRCTKTLSRAHARVIGCFVDYMTRCFITSDANIPVELTKHAHSPFSTHSRYFFLTVMVCSTMDNRHASESEPNITSNYPADIAIIQHHCDYWYRGTCCQRLVYFSRCTTVFRRVSIQLPSNNTFRCVWWSIGMVSIHKRVGEKFHKLDQLYLINYSVWYTMAMNKCLQTKCMLKFQDRFIPIKCVMAVSELKVWNPSVILDNIRWQRPDE